MENNSQEYYQEMINSLFGLEDDLCANQAPQEAIELMRRVIEICRQDFGSRFPTVDN